MIVIIGAGISGITSGNLISKEKIILEKEDAIGGLCTQYHSQGYWFDFGGHYFHFKNKKRVKLWLEVFTQFNKYKKNSKVFLMNRLIPFPLQYHLSYLPERLRNTIVTEMLDAQRNKSQNLENYLLGIFGEKMVEIFFNPFLSKLWSTDLRDLSAEMNKNSIPVPNKTEIVQSAMGKKFPSVGYNPEFFYPRNGLKPFIENYANKIRPIIHLQEPAIKLNLQNRSVTTTRSTYHYDWLINTMPLKELLKITEPKDNFPDHSNLKHISTLVVNAVLRKKSRRFHWVYLSEKRFPFYRVGIYPGQSTPSFYLEKTSPPLQPFNKNELYQEMVFTLKELHLIESSKDLLFWDPKMIPISYILFDEKWKNTVPDIHDKLRKHNVFSIGRYGFWTYTSMGDDVKKAAHIADFINSQ